MQAPARPGALAHDPENRNLFEKGSCAKLKCYKRFKRPIDRRQMSELLLESCVLSAKGRTYIMALFSTLSDIDLEKQVAALSRELAALRKAVSRRGGSYYEDGREAASSASVTLCPRSGGKAGRSRRRRATIRRQRLLSGWLWSGLSQACCSADSRERRDRHRDRLVETNGNGGRPADDRHFLSVTVDQRASLSRLFGSTFMTWLHLP
jgi:hypothetical protein